ncbi:hypothetical protein GJ688_03160 [Heliobacillus mobilis]|uniref:peptidylprolyl isomerase n=1 Tax=Heliobacterium mobile TaxID=28064 RepID=A0A6I3SGP3_HELMO|nr:peptidylprolyl isomerase [Heliobacterium mobile]MTV47977.1 hypothetical protein [Heliobacterium mobile]
MKRYLKSLFLGLIFAGIFATSASASDIKVYLDGKSIDFPDVKPYINEDDRLMVPVRFISDQFGDPVTWDDLKQEVMIKHKDKIIEIPIGQQWVYVDGIQVNMPTKAVNSDGRVMVPLGVIGTFFDITPTWNGNTLTVKFFSKEGNGTKMKNNKYSKPPEMTIDSNKKYMATVNTTKGQIKIELLADKAPITVNNFVFLAKDNFYEGVRFHRIIKNFMIQTGDPDGNGTGGPGYRFADELPPALPYGPGVVAMANAGPNTNGSQFFICNGDDSKFLNQHPNYTVFGKVIEGMDVVLKISDTPVGWGSGGERSKPMEEVLIESISIEEK